MDGTIMTHTCQLQQFMAEHPPPNIEGISKEKKFRQIILKDDVYDLLLTHIRKSVRGARAYSDAPHPQGSVVLTRYAKPVRYHRVDKGTHDFIVSPMAPNNCVCYTQLGRRKYGIIEQIYMFEGPSGKAECGVLIKPIIDRFGKDLESPSKHFRFTLYLLRTVVGEVSDWQVFLSPAQITSVAVYRFLPPHTFGLKNGGITLTSVLFSHSFVS